MPNASRNVDSVLSHCWSHSTHPSSLPSSSLSIHSQPTPLPQGHTHSSRILHLVTFPNYKLNFHPHSFTISPVEHSLYLLFWGPPPNHLRVQPIVTSCVLPYQHPWVSIGGGGYIPTHTFWGRGNSILIVFLTFLVKKQEMCFTHKWLRSSFPAKLI